MSDIATEMIMPELNRADFKTEREYDEALEEQMIMECGGYFERDENGNMEWVKTR
jgi:hypothetical protein